MPNHEELYSYLENKYGKKTDALAAPTDGSKVVDTDDALLERMRLSSSLRDMSMGTQMRNIHDTVEGAITSNPTHLYNYLTTDDDNTEQPSQVRGKALAEKIQPAYDSVKGEDKDFVASKYATADKLIDDLYATSEDGTIEIDGYKYPKATVSNVMRGIVENTMHPQLFATNKDYRANYFLSNFGKDEQSYYTDRLGTLDKELNELLQMISNEASSEAQSMTSAANQFGYSNIATPAVQFGLQESMGANVVRDAIDKINSLKKGTLWAGVNEGFDWVSALSMGLNDIASSASLSKILNKITEDEPLSPREELAFKAYTLSKEVDSIGDIVGRNKWNDIGQSLGKISEFALPMAAPVKLATTGVKMTSLGVKEALATTIAVGKKSIPTAIGRGILETAKVGGRLGANVARAEIAGAMLAPFTPITWANFAEKRLQQYSVNNDGEIEFKPSKLWKDIVDVEIEQANEIASEIFGLPLQKVIGNSAKTFGRLLRLDVVADKVGLGVDKRFIFGLRKPAAVREFERSLGFAGLFGDGSSEILGEYLSESMKSVITGNGDVSRLNNSEFWGNTLLISALYGGSLSIATLPLSIEEYKRSDIYQASKSRGVALSRIEDRELRNKMLTISAIDDIEMAAKELAQLDWSAMPRKDIAAAMDFVRADYMEKVLLGDAKENMRMNAYTGVALNTTQYVYRGEDGSTPTDDIISIDTEDGRYMVISGVLDNTSNSELICRDANGKIVPIHASKIQGIYKHSLQEELGEQYKQQFGVQVELDRQQEIIEKLNAIENPTKNDITSVMSSFGVAEHQQGDEVILVDGRRGVVDSLEDDGNYIVGVVDNQGTQYLSVPFYDILADDATMAEAQQMNYMQRSVSNLDEYSQKVKETAPEERNGIAIGDIVSAADGRRGRVLSFNEDGTITIDENISNTSGNLDDAYIANVAESDVTKESATPQSEPNAPETPTDDAKEVTEEVTEEVVPEPVIAEIKPIPTKEDGSVDYDAIDDPVMFAEQFSKDMGGAEEASVQVSKMFWATQKEIEKLMAQRETLTDANEVVSNRKAVNALNNKLQLYKEVIKRLNPEPKSGIIENEYSMQLDPKFKQFINTMAETFGLSVEFVEGIKGNAQIDGNKVKIAWEHRDKGIKFLIGHEFTHRMQDLSPEQYAKFKASVKEFMGEDAWNEQMARMKQTYIYNNVRFDVTLLEDEVVADFVGALVEQADAFDRYINSVEDKGILATIAKVLRSIRDFIFNAEAEAAKPLTEMLDKLDTLIESSEVAQSETHEMEHLGEKNTAQGKEKHSLIGEQGAANLDKAEEATTRLDNLAVARDMETAGKDAKAIRMATGWERGADGLWRYEIMDAEVNLYEGNENTIRKKIEVAEEEEKDFMSQSKADTKELRERTNNYLAEMREKYGVAEGEETDVMTEEEIAQLQSLTNKEIEFEDYKERRRNELYNHRMALEAQLAYVSVKNSEAPAEIATTRLGHILQGNDAEMLFTAHPSLRDIEVQFVTDIRDGAFAAYATKGGYKRIELNAKKTPVDMITPYILHEVQHAIQDIEGFAGGGNLSSLQSDENVTAKEAYDYYRKIAGEVEARNVSARINMTPEERRATLLSETEDVAREDQIFLREGAEMAMAESKKKSANETVSPNNSDHPAAISSADGAKILKNIDNLARKYQEKSNRPDTFIGDVADALGIDMPNKSSKYRTYETISGDIVTIRLSNHGATASKLDANNETNAVSIVIANSYDGITNDGEAHIVEYFYDAIKLRKADGKPLVGIINSLKQTLYSGKYVDNTGIAEVKEVNAKYSLITPEKEDIRYSLPSLVGVHNISLDKLRKAIKMGGLANPSVAVIDVDKQTHDDYGEYSLVLPKNMVDARQGKNAGTWAGDAWTPTYPQVVKRMNDGKAISRFHKDIEALPEAMRNKVRLEFDSFMEGRSADPLAYWYLFEKGSAPELVLVPSRYSDDITNAVSEATRGSFSMYGLTLDERAMCVDAYIAAKFNGDRATFEQEMQERIGRLTETLETKKSDRVKKWAQDTIDSIKEYGFDYDAVADFIRDVQYDVREKGTVNDSATIMAAREQIKANNLDADYEAWLNGLEERYGIEEYIFDGYTNSGNRRYLPHTLENVSKWMKKQGRQGAVATFPSFGVFIANAIPKMTTLESIRKRKVLLGKSKEEYDAFREKWENVYFELGKKLQPDAKGFDDYGYWRLIEAVGHKNPKEFVKKEYNIELSEEDMAQLNDMVNAIRTEYPARYFETKFERPLQLSDFVAAVVPNDVPMDVYGSLKEANVEIFEYEKGDNNSRAEAMQKASEVENVRFSLQDVEAQRFNRKVDFIKGLAREYNIPNPVFIAETKEEFVQMVKDYGGEVSDDTPEAYGVYIPDDDIILLNGGKLITSGDAHRSTMHEYAHSITKKYLGERLAEITSSIPEKEIDKARKEMLPEAYSDYSYSEVIDEFTSLLLEDLTIAETRAIFEGEMAIDTFVEKLKKDINAIEKISNKDVLYAVIPLVVENLKIQKEQYGKDREHTIVIPRVDSRRNTTLGQASHLWGDKKSRSIEAESRVYETGRGGEGSQEEVNSRYALLSAPITEEEQIRIYLRQKHLKNKEDIRKKYRAYRSAARLHYNEERAKRSAALKDMRSYAAKVEYILGDQVEQTIPYEHQALAKIARGEIKMPWKALSKELGLKNGDKRYYSGIIKDADPNVTFDGVVHQWWMELGGYTKDIDDQDLRNALIEALSTASSSNRALSVLREIYDNDAKIKDEALDAADLMEAEELAAEDARYAEEENHFNDNKDKTVEEFVRTASFYNQIEVVDATVMQIRERLEKTQMALTHRQQMRYYQGVMETIAELKQAVKDVVLSKTVEVLDRNALRSVIDKIDKARSVSEVDSVLAEIEEISLNATIKAQMKNMGRMLQLRLPDGVSVEEWVNAQVKEGRLSRADGDAILRDKWKGRNAKGVSVAKKVDVTTAAIFEKLSELIYPILAIKGKQRVSDNAVPNNNAIIDQLRDDKIAAEHGVAGVTFTEAKEIELQARILYDKFLQTEMLKSDADECMDTRSEIEQHYYGVAGKEAVREKHLTANRKALNEINRQRKEAIDEFNEALLSLMGSGRDALTMFRREQEAHKSMVVNMALDALGVGNRLVSNPPTAMEKVGAFVRSVPNAPYYTFQTTLREIDRLAPNGEGRFYNYLMSAWTESNNNFITQHNSHIEEVADALSRILGVKGANNADIIMNMIELSDDKPLLTVHYGGEEAISKATPESKVLTLSNALYVIAMWRQARYRASMEYHGFTQQMYNAVYDAVVSENEKYITFIDWVNNELLPDTRLIYDKVHREMFGASMANERNYFPARLVDPQKAEDISLNDVGALPSTMTGAIVNRINNKNMVNLNMNYFKVLMSHLQEMDQWSTFAPLIRDLNAIVSDKTFKKSCNTLKPGIKADRSGAGSLFTIFKTVSAIAVNCYRPSHQNDVEDFLIGMTRGWAGSNIAFRFSTALKQLASSPVFAAYATDPKCLSIWAKNSAKTFAHQKQILEWAKANSPMFKKRWESKFAGMDIFESKVREGNEGVYNAVKSSKVGKGIRTIDDAITKAASKYGMTPNAFIDAMTVANGIRTVYEYEVYLAEKRNGGKPATEEQKRKALVKAEIAFNESQQSSESAFVSQWQSNRTLVTRSLATYQNSAYGFHRLRIAAANEYWKQTFNEDYRSRLVDTYGPEQAKKMMEDARKKAMAQLLQGTVGDMIFVLMGAAGTVPLFTYLGGDDDEGEAWDLLKTAMVNMALNVATGGHALGSLLNSGLFGYNMSLDTAWENLVTQWNVLWDYDVLSWPFAYQALNIVAVNRYGVDFDTLANIATGIEGLVENESSVEAVMKVLNIPQSQINLVAGKRRKGESIQEYVARRLRIESIGAIPYIDESGKVIANQGYWQNPLTPRKSYVAKYRGEFEDANRRATLTKIGGNDEYRDFVKTEEEYKDVVKALGWTADTKPNNDAYINGVYSVPPIDGLSKEDYNALWKLAYEAAHAAKDEEKFVGTEDRYYDKLKVMTEKRQKLIDRYNEL
ncbi:MAG: hypothetical protein J6U48_04905 [Alistipes sp.]|nr:hypothetical protein [Alistipes sp.]